MDKAKEVKNLKIVVPLLVLASLALAVVAAVTGAAVFFGIGIAGMLLTLAVASWSSYKSRRDRRAAERRDG